LADNYQGKRLNSPNDVVVKSDGSIYFTDPPYGIQESERELNFQGVYRIAPDGVLTLLVDNLNKPNGLAFSPDEKILYVDDADVKQILAFDVKSDGTLANRRIFADMSSQQQGAADGMKVDVNGNLYVSCGVVWVFDKNGNHLGDITVPEIPSNCAFGGSDNKTLFITARTSVYKVELNIQGIKVTINKVNNPPVLADIPDQTIDEGKAFTAIKLDDYVSDPDNTDAEIAWTASGNTNITVTIGADRMTIIAVKDAEWNGSEIITFTAKDPGGLSASKAVKFTVKPINDPPTITDIPEQLINKGETFKNIKLDDYVSDPDNTDAEMIWTFTGNTKLSIVIDANRIVNITITDTEWSGTENITFTAKDPGGLSTSKTVIFTVKPVDNPPITANNPPVLIDIPDQTINEGQSFTSINLDDYGSDPDNKDEEIIWTYTGNSNLKIIVKDRIANISADPKWNGTETVTFTAKDPGGLSASDTAKFTVIPVNDPPIISDIPDQSITAGQNFADVKLDDYITDPDNADSEITWSFSGNSKLLINIDADRVAKITILEKAWRGSETITFTAKDPAGLSASDKVNFEVKILKGDMNKDNKVSANDAIIVLQIAVGIREADDYEKIAGDINGDGKIMSNDAIAILNIIVKSVAPGVNIPSAEPIALTMSDIHGVVGDVITFPMEIDNTQSLAGGDIQIVYDSNVIQAFEVLPAQGTIMANNISQNGVIKIAFAGSDRLTNKTLANIKFKVVTNSVSAIKVKSIDLYGFDGNSIKTTYTDKRFLSWAVAPEKSVLMQNYPNPFNPETWIPFQLKNDSQVTIQIYSASGELVRRLELGYKSAGVYTSPDRSAYWNGKNEAGEKVSSGLYFCTIQAGEYSSTMKMIVTK
jgi:roadblock/LC7 domain-containing protein